jgi:hypothetical protein
MMAWHLFLHMKAEKNPPVDPACIVAFVVLPDQDYLVDPGGCHDRGFPGGMRNIGIRS